jgi:hypothetical protein
VADVRRVKTSAPARKSKIYPLVATLAAVQRAVPFLSTFFFQAVLKQL